MRPSRCPTRARPLLALSCGVLLGCRGAAGVPEPGTEFFAVAPETVMEVTYSSDTRKLYAYRWRPGESFQLFVGRRDTSAEQCTGGGGFNRWLSAVSRIPVQRELRPKLDEGKGEWAEVRVRDTNRAEPVEMTLHVPTDAGPVVLAFKERQYAVDVDAAVLRSLASGCSALGGAK